MNNLQLQKPLCLYRASQLNKNYDLRGIKPKTEFIIFKDGV